MFIVTVMKNLFVNEVGKEDTRYSYLYTVPPCYPEEKGASSVLPLVSMEGETTQAKQLLVIDLIVFVFISRTIRYAEYIQMKDESYLLDPRRFTKR
jgi:hypothetical protein